MLHTLDDAIEEWAPKNWTNESPNIRLARINNSNVSIEYLIHRFANRLIHCSIRVDESFFHCSFIGNGEGSDKRMAAEIENIRNQERIKNQRETGFFETNQEQKQRIQREKTEAEEERKRLQFEAMVSEMKAKFQSNPLSRFDNIKKLGKKKNYRTTYVIELDRTIMQSQSERAYPSTDGIFPETRLHTSSSRCFYVGQTWHSAEERFHTANVNHMAKTTGKVSKHRLIKDGPPYLKSVKSINELTESFGFENPKNGNQSDNFEHYVAWALYKCGHRTWGPKNSDLGRNYQNGQWLGEDPYI